MENTWTELLPLASYCFLMSSTPGPNNVMLTAAGARHGYRSTLPHLVGINAGVALQTFLMCIGLGQVFVAWPWLHHVLRIAGSLYLLVLAWQLLGAAPVTSAREGQPLSFVHGVMFQAVNPKSWVKALTLASVFMPAGMALLPAAALVAVLGWIIGFPCSSMWVLFGVGIRRWLANPLRWRLFNAMMGGSLFVMAVLLLREA
ncbi:LysE family translocator [Paucibacter sp. R3-3]|uniref:LysE family translocator n=1 Tax=Roseateles agri TaxID=3098619 RepID=A0ABU5DKM8_9BURK|nr:LysE family translocator [Paucibacter sp. R3-3]MDY0746694.1 LysE family translocator [Paucibacter sp. R3-3]